MSLQRRLREARDADAERELKHGIRRTVPQTLAPADIEQLRRERLPWYKRRK